ncbi:hypothetical protein GA0111570_101230 [Raineyella antarctica]|uniref:Spermatogenesis-associated protein 20-like TRX domain-containing protein n=1 Tax=Raineyella antarctica TaxID=1577474 RepID=A0A1G6GD86_9ACTN|nr:thioredoxin domain-containing protein [Raineyella antarctica]SDB79957.1 hypothetical protein GA0111570_101230 [Raineyella antarctica]
MANRLAGAISPYLQQHADNPVDWYPWGPEAFAAAQERNVPILLSVGYASCHWCHVMAHESFEDSATAKLINDDFVAIKVDREERPDVDAVYMNATQALSGQGGWPMTVFCTPEGEPFQAGTYYPPEPRQGMPGFRQLLEAVTRAWAQQREGIEESAHEVVAHVEGATVLTPAMVPATLGTEDVEAAWERLLPEYDPVNGGFGRAPKFPTSMVLEALLRIQESTAFVSHLRGQAGDMAFDSLEAMARGGLCDQVGGGFHRYSVDAQWVVPHFEKMLYDNALLLPAYAHAATLVGDSRRALFTRVADDLVEWLGREMTTPQGAFAAALDADSADPLGQRVEGEYYIWNPAQIQQVIGDQDYRQVLRMFHVTDPGTFEGYASTLQLPVDPDGLGPDGPELYRRARELMREVRAHRPAPARDDKVVASWNGWMVSGLVRASHWLGRPQWLDAAVRAAEAVWAIHLVDGRLRRVSRDGAVSDAPATLDDHGALAEAYALLAEATGDVTWVERARALVALVEEHFGAGDGGWWDTADDAPGLWTRPRALDDNATPSGVGSMVAALRLLTRVTGEESYDARADRAVRTQAHLLRTAPRFAGTALADTVDRLVRPVD